MEKIKTILDREPLSSDYIRSKQDFANVVKGAKGLGKPFWQTNWFYGTVGVTAVAVVVTAVTLSSSGTQDEKPQNNQMIAATSPDDTKQTEKEATEIDPTKSQDSEKDMPEEVDRNEPTEVAPSNVETKEPTSNKKSKEVEESSSNNTARKTAAPKEADKSVEIGSPNLAGVTGGPISFKDFCDPLGIQVEGGVLIHQYTIQYRSCARDISARVRGNRLPSQVCEEIQDCGAPIEVTFSNFKAEDRNGNPVQLKEFSLTTRP